MDKNISFTLKVWRQKGPKAKGTFLFFKEEANSILNEYPKIAQKLIKAYQNQKF